MQSAFTQHALFGIQLPLQDLVPIGQEQVLFTQSIPLEQSEFVQHALFNIQEPLQSFEPLGQEQALLELQT